MSRRILCWLMVLSVVLALPAAAQVINFEDVSPDSSDYDPSDPDGASGGRVNGIVVDPNSASTLYAASEWGGIYTSVDSGLNWSRLDGHRPVATWDVAVDPSNSSRLYASSFYDGRATALSGINVSTDKGVTWTRPATAVPLAADCNSTADQTELTAFGISIDPDSNASVYIGTSCGLAVTEDSGATWTYEAPAASASRMWDVLKVGGTDFVHTCGDAGHWVWNVDTEMWSQGSGLPSGRCSLAVSPYDANNLFAVVGTSIYETADGSLWTRTSSNPRPQGRIPFVATNIRDVESEEVFDLWFGDVSLYRVSCDNAATPSCGTGSVPAWVGPFTRTAGGHDDMGDIAFDPVAANDACPILMSSDGGVYRNLTAVSPACHSPSWEQPDVTPHGLWPWTMSGGDVATVANEDLYFGNQDNGTFGTTTAGAATPSWSNVQCCDGFDSAVDDSDGTVLYSICCFGGGPATRFYKAGPGFTNVGFLPNQPPGTLPGFKYPDAVARWGIDSYAMITRGGSGGVYITTDIDAGTVPWTALGEATEPPTSSLCGIKAGVAGGVPTFYAQTGNCNGTSTSDRVFRFEGTDPAGAWTEITLPSGGFGFFDVNQSDPMILLAAGFTSNDALMYKSTDGGATWMGLPQLDTLMRGNGDFPIRNSRGPSDFTGMNGYRQPSFVALDPTDSNVHVAGGMDSGVFVTTNGGLTWSLVTDPRGSHTSGIPHIPRPRFAYFDAEAGSKQIFIGSQGRGIWRLTLGSSCPANVTIANETVTGTDTYGATSDITVGPEVLFDTGSDTILEAGNRIEMLDGTTVVGDMSVVTTDYPYCAAPSIPEPVITGAPKRAGSNAGAISNR